MFLLGTGIIYSRKKSSKILLTRGIKTFLLGYVLNLARGTIPKIIGLIVGQEIEINEIYLATFIIDILQFSGLAFIAFAGLTKLKLTINWYIIIFLIFLVIIFAFSKLFPTQLIFDQELEEYISIGSVNNIVDPILGLIFGAISISYFSFVPWFIYPLAGYIFGYYLIRTKNVNKFYLTTFSLSLVSVGIYFIFYSIGLVLSGYENDPQYYNHNWYTGIYFIAFVILEISMIYFIISKLKLKSKNVFVRLSSQTTNIYIIHWVIIGWLQIFIIENSIGISTTVILTIIITVISMVLSEIWDMFKKTKSESY